MLALQFNPLDFREEATLMAGLLVVLNFLALASLPVIAYQLYRLANANQRARGEQHLARVLNDPWLLVAQQLLQRPNGPILVPVELVPTFGARSVPFDQRALLEQHRPGLPPGEETPVESLLNETLERLFLWLDEAHYQFTTGALRRKDLSALRGLLRSVVQPPSVEDPKAKPLVQYLKHTSHEGTLKVLFLIGLTLHHDSQTARTPAAAS